MWLRQTEHFRDHFWHIYSAPVNQVMVETINLSKRWLQLNHKEPLVFSITLFHTKNITKYFPQKLEQKRRTLFSIGCYTLPRVFIPGFPRNGWDGRKILKSRHKNKNNILFLFSLFLFSLCNLFILHVAYCIIIVFRSIKGSFLWKNKKHELINYKKLMK